MQNNKMAEKTQEFRQIVRIAETDVPGNRPLLMALKQITGVGFSMSNAICTVLGLDKRKKIGDLPEAELRAAEEMVRHPEKLPKWMYNRRKDFESGKDMHLTNVDLKLSTDFDIKRMKKIKSYKGIRHAMGQPVRGQRTRSNSRKGKSIGVAKKAKATKK